MMMRLNWKLIIVFILPVILWFTPAPEGLSITAWHAFAIYLAAIVGLVLKPFPESVILLAAVGTTALLLNNPKDVLSGYASNTTWLIFAAFALSCSFSATGLGRRIAYILIGKLGGTSLGLGYVTAFLDMSIAPVTPSNTARAGGIVFPIIQSVAVALDSNPGETAKKIGSYLMINTYMITKITSIMFLTGMAPNGIAIEYVHKILGISIDWVFWFKGLFLPSMILMLLLPLIIYWLTKPTLKKIDHKKVSGEGLKELGPITKREWMLIGLFLLALLGWVLPSVLQVVGIKLDIDATSVAIVIMAASFITRVITWDDMLKSKGGWSSLIWFGGIIGLSSVLSNEGFFDWLALVMKHSLNFGNHYILALWGITLASVVVRYLFASGSAYIAAMFPVFLIVGQTVGIAPVALAFSLCASNGYGGALTHYTGGPAPIIFGAGYNSIKSWWGVGAIVALISYLFMMVVGMIWWRAIGLF